MMKIVPTTITPKKFKAIGRLRYSPTNNGKSERRDGGTTKWWLVLDCDPNIGRYYRELYSMAHYGVHTIQRPTWDAHITIIANEKPPDESFWLKYEGKKIQYEYLHQPDDNGLYIWLPVVCEQALDIRQEMGLPRNPYYPLHLTVGNCKQ